MKRDIVPLIEDLNKLGTQMYVYDLGQGYLWAYKDQYGNYILFSSLSNFMLWDNGDTDVERIYVSEYIIDEIENDYEMNSYHAIKSRYENN